MIEHTQLTKRQEELAAAIGDLIEGFDLNDAFTAMLSVMTFNLQAVYAISPSAAVATANRYSGYILGAVDEMEDRNG